MSKTFPVYKKGGEIPYDAIKHRHVIVFDVNLTNTYGHDLILRRLKVQYPAFFEELLRMTFENKLSPGHAFIRNIDGMTLVGLINCLRPFDKNYDDPDTVKHLSFKAMQDMVNRLGNDCEFVSSIIGSHHGIWGNIYNHIRELKLNWTVMPE